MQLGNFSVSLAVKDLAASKAFYGKLGFSVFAGQEDHGYLILKNDDVVIGIFQGMFEKNILTFNPGWDAECNTLDDYTDVRDLKAAMESAGIEVQQFNDGEGSGPGSFVVVDPDGNPILIDQHV